MDCRKILILFLFIFMTYICSYGAQQNPVINNMTAGELSPKMDARVDLVPYANGAKTITNFVVIPFGGITRVPGTYFVNSVKYPDNDTRLIPFQFNTEQSYVLEFGDKYIRVYKDGGQVVSGSSPVEITTPYEEADLFDLKFAQNADTMIIVHKDYAPRKLTRSSHTSWTLDTLTYQVPVFGPQNTTSYYMTPSATSGSINITATGGTAFPLSASAYIGRNMWLNSGYVEITGKSSDTVLTGTVKKTLSGTGADTAWKWDAFNSTDGYPGSVTFFEQRLVFAGNKTSPQTVWMSKTASYYNFETGSSDDNAITFTVGSDQVNSILWMSGDKVLVLGTYGGIFNMSSGSSSEPITPSSVTVVRETTYGTSNISPKKIGSYLYYLQKNNRTLREYVYNYEVDAYLPIEISLLSEHITESGIKEIDYQQSPYNIMWCVRNDGDIALMTRQIEQKVTAWSHVTTDGKFESVACIPNGDEDQIWVVVNRDNDGSTGRYIEYFMPFEPDNQESSFYVQSGLSYRGSPITTVSGLDHLEGKTVTVYADNESIGTYEVDNGSIELDCEASVINVGLPYDSEFKTLRIEAGASKGTAQGHTGKVFQAVIRYLKSQDFYYGNGVKYYEISSSYSDDSTDTNLLTMPSGWSTDKYITIKSKRANPLTVLGIFPRIETND